MAYTFKDWGTGDDATDAEFDRMEAGIRRGVAKYALVPPVGYFLGPYMPLGSATNRTVPSTNPVPTAIFVPTLISVDQVGIQVAALEAGRSAKVLIYATDDTGVATDKVIETVHSLASTGNVITTLDTAYEMVPGLYWANIIADVATTTATIACMNQAPAHSVFGTFNQLQNSGAQGGPRFDVGTYAAPAATANILYNNAWGTNNNPIVGLRRSA